MIKNFMSDYILWLDTETTGLDPNENFIFQLAYFGTKDGEVLFHNNLRMRPKEIEKFKYNESGALKHRISFEEIKNYPLEEEQFSVFLRDVRSVPSKFMLAGWNINFDKEFLKAIYSRQNALYNDFYRISYDVMQTFIGKAITKQIEPENFKLETAVNYYNINIDGCLHDAYYDTISTMLVHQKIFEKTKEEEK